ncbi:MAG TPA: alpha/beta hydrolase [Gemmatimonadetes bacterium]|nr:alpha/beta hydrolase [Gemmatimonadota bacterium]HIB09055.1 alpha/beta hydrolase [Gemmatimonadota bacterium]HIN78768.1 alpha/beta hydrolase [Gemmatimonadota bacterium]
MRNGTFSALILAALVVFPSGALAQIDDTQAWASHLSNQYRVLPNVTYLTASNRDNKVDLYLPRGTDGPAPVLVYIHGGGWVGGSKESSVLRLVPWMEMGWAVVNVQYRLGEVSLAPAAVEDCLCALRWIIRNAGNYNIDPERIVVTGNSAGGHLALTTGMVPASAGLDGQCPGSETLSVAAIINWYGITDVGDLLDGPNTKSYAVEWMGSMPNRFEIADRVSPLTYVRAGLPPILTIHGDADPTVPYQHGVQLHEELTKVGVSNQLHTVPGGRHGGFNRPETIAIFETIQEFLKSNGLLK